MPQTAAMGTFATTCRVENHLGRTRLTDVNLIVDSGSECTWVPRRTLEGLGISREKKITFVMANGTRVTRSVGFAIEGLNLTVDPAGRRLVAGGPVLAATPVRARR